MRRMPIPDRRIFHRKDMRPRGIWGIRPSFPGLSPCPGQVAYVLLTSAPVAARSIATSALPLDLHVLSLSLAFILSQDQTLRCCIIVSLLYKRYNENATLDRSLQCSNPWPLFRLNLVSYCLLYIVLNDLESTRTIPKNYPLSLVLLVAANMSKSYCMTPPLWRKAVQRYCHF